MKVPAVRIVRGAYVTHHPVDGFRARCACGWVGEWHGYAVAHAYEDADDHEAKGCGR